MNTDRGGGGTTPSTPIPNSVFVKGLRNISPQNEQQPQIDAESKPSTPTISGGTKRQISGSSSRKKTSRARDNYIEKIKKRVIGQDHVIGYAVDALLRKKTGWADREHPMVMMFVGPTGVGKTEMAKALAEVFYEGSYIRLDMAEYQLEHSVTKLYGAPPSYAGYQEGGVLTNKLHENSSSIVLLDEVEKAHPRVIEALMTAFGEGIITDSQGHKIDCSDTVFIMTSNLGAKMIADASLGQKPLDEARLRQELDAILNEHFKRPELIGRMNAILMFKPLLRDSIAKIVELKLEALKQRAAGAKTAPKHLQQKDSTTNKTPTPTPTAAAAAAGTKKAASMKVDKRVSCNLRWTHDVSDYFVEVYLADPKYGVRSIKNSIENDIVTRLSDAQLDGTLVPGSDVLITLEDGELGLEIEPPLEPVVVSPEPEPEVVPLEAAFSNLSTQEVVIEAAPAQQPQRPYLYEQHPLSSQQPHQQHPPQPFDSIPPGGQFYYPIRSGSSGNGVPGSPAKLQQPEVRHYVTYHPITTTTGTTVTVSYNGEQGKIDQLASLLQLPRNILYSGSSGGSPPQPQQRPQQSPQPSQPSKASVHQRPSSSPPLQQEEVQPADRKKGEGEEKYKASQQQPGLKRPTEKKEKQQQQQQQQQQQLRTPLPISTEGMSVAQRIELLKRQMNEKQACPPPPPPHPAMLIIRKKQQQEAATTTSTAASTTTTPPAPSSVANSNSQPSPISSPVVVSSSPKTTATSTTLYNASPLQQQQVSPASLPPPTTYTTTSSSPNIYNSSSSSSSSSIPTTPASPASPPPIIHTPTTTTTSTKRLLFVQNATPQTPPAEDKSQSRP